MRGATNYFNFPKLRVFISIHAPHAGSDYAAVCIANAVMISIHAPHAGSDGELCWDAKSPHDFNPRSPCGERNVPILQSRCDFNPRSPCGERLYSAIALAMLEIFQSTLPMRGATIWNFVPILIYKISIHAPHAGSDELFFQFDSFVLDFNPRSPCGERLTEGHGPLVAYNFNPRSPCGERPQIARQRRRHRHFNPRSPCGERLESGSPLVWLKAFQSTLPMRGAT